MEMIPTQGFGEVKDKITNGESENYLKLVLIELRRGERSGTSVLACLYSSREKVLCI